MSEDIKVDKKLEPTTKEPAVKVKTTPETKVTEKKEPEKKVTEAVTEKKTDTDLVKEITELKNTLKNVQRQLKEDRIANEVKEKEKKQVEPNESTKRII